MSRPGPARRPDVDWAADWANVAETHESDLARGYASPARCAEALASCAADRAAPLAEFGCGTGRGGTALAQVGFSCIDGFDPSDAMLRAAAQTGAYRRLVRADLGKLGTIAPGAYANAVAIGVLDLGRHAPEVLDAVLALLPNGGCFAFSLPGSGPSIGFFRSRILELCEHFVAEPTFRAAAPAVHRHGLQSTVYVLKKR